MLSNAYFLAKFRFDTAENEPAKQLQKFAIFPNFANPNPPAGRKVAETNDKARDLVAVAGNNGPKMCVVSGDKDVVEAVIEAAGCTGKRGN